MDKIFIKQLKIDTLIGIDSTERRQRQTVIVNLDLGINLQKAANSDNIADTVDYAKVTQRIKEFFSHSQFYLLESLAAHTAEMIIEEFNIMWLRISVEKLNAIENTESVGVVLERQIDNERPPSTTNT